MTPYERGYAAGLKAAADECGSELDPARLRERILSLPIVGEAPNAGTNANQPVAESQAPAPSEPGDRGVAPTLAESRPARSGPCVSVPVEPTEKMLAAAGRAYGEYEATHMTRSNAWNRWRAIYAAMLAAAKEEHDAHR